jgi:hypothetical protein
LITKTGTSILQGVSAGQTAIDINASAWIETEQSFLTLNNIRSYPTDSDEVSREDECHLLFITQCQRYSRVLICPWKPFGSTAVSELEPKAQEHMCHDGHCLEYASWRWNLDRGPCADDKGFKPRGNITRKLSPLPLPDLLPKTVPFDVFPSELLLEVATRSIFGWL